MTRAGWPGTIRATIAPFCPAPMSSTLNGASIYLEARRKPDSYQTADGKPLKDDIFHSVLPKGPAGQFSYHVPFSNMLMGYSKNQKAAKEFLRWIGSPPVFMRSGSNRSRVSRSARPPTGKSRGSGRRTRSWAVSSGGSQRPVCWLCRTVRTQAAEAVTKYIIVDMYAKAVQGMAPEDSVKWAHEQLVKIYA